ncbi:MAG TPA: metalloregulator ArsR/SmtB family transcription factor [Acidimicrobiales bacterium]|nr:metalloregulator ArsR/SmtB family transcription factor [Acidimicrobiales bacterium]
MQGGTTVPGAVTLAGSAAPDVAEPSAWEAPIEMHGEPQRSAGLAAPGPPGAPAPSPDAVLDALGDRTRRAILRRLRLGPRSVGDLAEGMTVGRPAVSQHLKVLKDARLVVDRRQGTRRLYTLDPRGLATLRHYAAELWSSAARNHDGAHDPHDDRPTGRRRDRR